jgi:hypothetical protein
MSADTPMGHLVGGEIFPALFFDLEQKPCNAITSAPCQYSSVQPIHKVGVFNTLHLVTSAAAPRVPFT